MLGACPDLQVLNIHTATKVTMDGAHLSVITLRRLHTLVLDLRQHIVARWFFDQLKVPALTNMELYIGYWTHNGTAKDLTDAVPAGCSAMRIFENIQGLHLRKAPGGKTVQLYGSRKENVVPRYLRVSDVHVAIGGQSLDFHRCLSQLTEHFPVQDVTTVSVDGFDKYGNVQDWKTFLHRLPHMHTLILSGERDYLSSDPSPLPQHLPPLRAISGDAHAISTLNLRNLTLDYVAISAICMGLLKDICRRLKATGTPLAKLEVLAYKGNPKAVEELESLVENLKHKAHYRNEPSEYDETE
jgi:hypothetical protein